MIEAAAMEKHSASPPMTQRTRQVTRGARLPSISARSGGTDGRGGNRDVGAGAGAQSSEGGFALVAGQAFGVVEQRGEVGGHAGAEDHGGSHDRSGERAASGLVDAGDAAAMFGLETVMRHGRTVAWMRADA